MPSTSGFIMYLTLIKHIRLQQCKLDKKFARTKVVSVVLQNIKIKKNEILPQGSIDFCKVFFLPHAQTNRAASHSVRQDTQ